MAINKQFSGYNQRSKFLVGKVSNFSPEPAPQVPYYQRLRHTRSKRPFQNRFLTSFDTQVIPYVLPGELPVKYAPPQPPETFRILSEIGFAVLTELGEYIVYEYA